MSPSPERSPLIPSDMYDHIFNFCHAFLFHFNFAVVFLIVFHWLFIIIFPERVHIKDKHRIICFVFIFRTRQMVLKGRGRTGSVFDNLYFASIFVAPVGCGTHWKVAVSVRTASVVVYDCAPLDFGFLGHSETFSTTNKRITLLNARREKLLQEKYFSGKNWPKTWGWVVI